MSITRRTFVKRSAAVGAAVAFPFATSTHVLGANDEIRVGVVGLGNRGAGSHIPRMAKLKGVRIAAICDPDRVRLDKTAAQVEKNYQYKAEPFVDMRKMLEKKDIDVICIGTMQYWHSLQTIWACQAGKHVYCEKPLGHFIWEGRQMVNAARKYDRLVQVGTQSRSQDTVYQTMKFIKNGQLGKIRYITCFANKPRTSVGKRTEPLPIPETLDYELWCGPARKEPIYRDRIQYDCSFTWNMGDGESCNQGVHEIDVARWLLGITELPRRVISIGGRFVFNDAGDVPNTQIIYYDYPEVPILYEVHNLTKAKGSKDAPTFRGVRTDVCVNCEGGYVMMRSGLVFDKDGKEIKKFTGRETHYENFVKALRSGKREDLHADVLEGHISTAICHAGNVSYRLGKTASVGEMKTATAKAPLFAEMFDRLLVHLKAHEIDPDTATLGPWLDLDPKNECFKDNAQANALVKGFYREPWMVPEIKA
ncbi:MAG: Gfo/Idh/MocA family oxidoreductase [Phycisphaerae bacterium]|nr:Gfo/Idh/MocA family oxidoreductase [Phycisphaerae bacterium]